MTREPLSSRGRGMKAPRRVFPGLSAPGGALEVHGKGGYEYGVFPRDGWTGFGGRR